MPEKSQFEHEFLDLKGEGMEDRTSLGGMPLGVRSKLFWALGGVSLLILGGVFMYVDQRIATAMDGWSEVREASILMARTQSGLARAEALEKNYMLDKKRELADALSEELSRVGMALDEFYGFRKSGPVRQHIATLRDGVEQYGQQFTQFVIAGEAMSLTPNTGISPHLQSLTKQLSRDFTAAGLADLADQIARIVRQGSEMLNLGERARITDIRERFRTLFQLLNNSKIPESTKRNLEKQLQGYKTDLMTTINSYFSMASARSHLGEILAYMAPSTDALWKFTNDLHLRTAGRIDRARSFARYSIAGATAAVFLWFMLACIILFRSVVSPLQELAFAAARLAGGDRLIQVPARGNVDATGEIARALDKWINDMSDADMARRELDQVRAELELMIIKADRKVQEVHESATPGAEREKSQGPTEPRRQLKAALVAPIIEEPIAALAAGPNPVSFAIDAGTAGPISSISQQLAHFSEYVTASAKKVERTETLIKNIGEATSHIEVLGNLVTAVRDQVNLLALRTSQRNHDPNGGENLIPFNGGERGEGEFGINREPMVLGRLDAVRDATNRAERTLQSARTAMESVDAVTQDIAKAASEEALEATNKLLSHSKYLRQILGDIITKTHPSKRNHLSPPIPQQGSPQGSRGIPPYKV